MDRHDLEDLFESFLKNKSLEMTADYVRRGRRLSGLSIDELRTQWAGAFERYVDSLQSGETDDYEAELSLRGKPLPIELVADAREALKKKVDEAFSDPERRTRAGEGILGDLVQFSAEIDESKKN